MGRAADASSSAPSENGRVCSADDTRLIASTLAGETDAFGELVQRYEQRVYRMLYQLAGCHEDASDIAQDAFLQAYVKLSSFRQGSRFYTWLYRIAFNQFVSHRRRRKAVRSIHAGSERGTSIDPVDDSPSPTRQLQSSEEISLVRQAISRLQEDQRAVIVLREMDGLCYDEIAEVVGVPVGTVRSRLSRARIQLRELLKSELETGTA